MLDVNVEKILPVTEVRDSLNKIIDEVEGSDELYVITKNGKPSAILVGVHHLEKLTGISHQELMPDDDLVAAGNATPAPATTDFSQPPTTPNSLNTPITPTPDNVPMTSTLSADSVTPSSSLPASTFPATETPTTPAPPNNLSTLPSVNPNIASASPVNDDAVDDIFGPDEPESPPADLNQPPITPNSLNAPTIPLPPTPPTPASSPSPTFTTTNPTAGPAPAPPLTTPIP